MTNFTANTIVRQSEECAWQEIRGRIIIVHPRDREIHRLNEAGSAIWQYIEKPRPLREVAARIAGEFDISETAALSDVKTFVGELSAKNLIAIQD